MQLYQVGTEDLHAAPLDISYFKNIACNPYHFVNPTPIRETPSHDFQCDQKLALQKLTGSDYETTQHIYRSVFLNHDLIKITKAAAINLKCRN